MKASHTFVCVLGLLAACSSQVTCTISPNGDLTNCSANANNVQVSLKSAIRAKRIGSARGTYVASEGKEFVEVIYDINSSGLEKDKSVRIDGLDLVLKDGSTGSKGQWAFSAIEITGSGMPHQPSEQRWLFEIPKGAAIDHLKFGSLRFDLSKILIPERK